MKWFFTPPADRGMGQQDDGQAPGLIALPDELLQRHGARVLDPEIGRAHV